MTESAAKQKAKTSGWPGITIDFIMMALLAVNVLLLIVDATFANITVQRALREHFTSFHDLYKSKVHENFVLIDGLFLAVFLIEFFVRWAIAALTRTYLRWFYYPLIHWYDLAGCIPLSSLRFLRGLRLVAIIYRLHRLGRIDVRRYYLYRVFAKYKAILTEEISDRVVVQVLSGMQHEASQGSPVLDRIWTEVVAPSKEEITQRVVTGAESLLRDSLERQRPQVGAYVEEVLDRALQQSRHVFVDLEKIPMLGATIANQIEKAIKVIVGNVVSELFDDADRIDVKPIAAAVERALTEALAKRDVGIDESVRRAVHESLEIVKDQVRVKQWKVRELAEQADKAGGAEKADGADGAGGAGGAGGADGADEAGEAGEAGETGVAAPATA